MPQFSVIVPVYNVEPYVRECLESILTQGVDDIEVLVVDDASTDGSGRVVDEVARGDERVRVTHLQQNVGLGPARNVALEQAQGEYLVFVDSDDWLAEGALTAIADRISETDPDVLLFDYARTFWHGGHRRNLRSSVFSAPVPDVFDLHDHPDLLNLLMVVWNKAYRRSFIADLGLRFYPGYYEDLPWTYPVMMAAKRISLLDRVCYLYRQRRHGNILGTASRRHFEAFDQYDRVFAFLDEHPELQEWRPVMHQRMTQHLLTILGKGEARVPSEDQREFFERAVRYYRRYRADTDLVKAADSLPLRIGAFAAYQALETSEQLRERLHRARQRARRRLSKRVRTRGRKARRKLLKLLYRLYRLQPLDENLAGFAAYWYRGYSCNPRALYEKLRELKPEIRGVWIVSGTVEEPPEGVPFVREGSAEYFRLLATAKYLVNNVNFPNHYVKRPGQVNVQTHHGTPLKSMGLDLQNYPLAGRDMNFKQLLRRSDRWDYSLSVNPYTTEVWSKAFPCGYQMLEYGHPRNDVFFRYTPQDRDRIRSALGIPADKTAVLYAPTFREYEPSFQSHLDLARFAGALDDSHVLLVRSHYFYEPESALGEAEARGAVVNVSAYPDVQELCIAADVLVTDYSSIMFDYANLSRPIVIYADDWDIYRRVRGTYFDLVASPPGLTATTEQELVDIFRTRSYAGEESTARLERFRNRFCKWDDGNASERVVRRIFLGEQVEAEEVHVADHDGLLDEQQDRSSMIRAVIDDGGDDLDD